MKLRLAGLALLLSASTSASAEEMWRHTSAGTGLWISDVCRSSENADVLVCLVFIRGVISGQDMVTAVGGGRNVYCRDDKTVTVEQMRRVIVKYADDHPEKLNLDMGVFVYLALSGAFPCPG